MSSLRFHLDEDCQAAALAGALRAHGIDATTTNEAGRAGVDDGAQLQHAAAAGRVIVSNNVGDFSALHEDWVAAGRDHGGIVLFPQQQYSVGEIVRRLLRLRQTLTAEEMRNRLEWLSNWGGR